MFTDSSSLDVFRDRGSGETLVLTGCEIWYVTYQNGSRNGDGRYLRSVGRQKRGRIGWRAKPVKALTRFELARRSIKIRLMHCDISHTVLTGACEMRVVYRSLARPATSSTTAR